MRVRLSITFLLCVVGIAPLLWWNGQFVTNQIMSSTCYLGCLVMWLPMLARRRPRQARITAAVLVVVNAVVLIVGTIGLPDALEKQRTFNQALEDIGAQQPGPGMTP
jgi:hypothetical protein